MESAVTLRSLAPGPKGSEAGLGGKHFHCGPESLEGTEMLCPPPWRARVRMVSVRMVEEACGVVANTV